MNDPSIVIITVGVVATVSVTIRSIANGIVRIKTASNSTRLDPSTGAVDARLGRLEQAVDAIAVEIERIAEGQRFTTRLLADRAQRDAVREPQRIDPPPA